MSYSDGELLRFAILADGIRDGTCSLAVPYQHLRKRVYVATGEDLPINTFLMWRDNGELASVCSQLRQVEIDQGIQPDKLPVYVVKAKEREAQKNKQEALDKTTHRHEAKVHKHSPDTSKQTAAPEQQHVTINRETITFKRPQVPDVQTSDILRVKQEEIATEPLVVRYDTIEQSPVISNRVSLSQNVDLTEDCVEPEIQMTPSVSLKQSVTLDDDTEAWTNYDDESDIMVTQKHQMPAFEDRMAAATAQFAESDDDRLLSSHNLIEHGLRYLELFTLGRSIMIPAWVWTLLSISDKFAAATVKHFRGWQRKATIVMLRARLTILEKGVTHGKKDSSSSQVNVT